jgi:hypothetical protein
MCPICIVGVYLIYICALYCGDKERVMLGDVVCAVKFKCCFFTWIFSIYIFTYTGPCAINCEMMHVVNTWNILSNI